MKKEDKYGNPTSCSTMELCVLLAWAADSGIKLEATDVTEILISHPKSKWDYSFGVDSAKERLEARKVLMNWINNIFPRNFEDCDWP